MVHGASTIAAGVPGTNSCAQLSIARRHLPALDTAVTQEWISRAPGRAIRSGI